MLNIYSSPISSSIGPVCLGCRFSLQANLHRTHSEWAASRFAVPASPEKGDSWLFSTVQIFDKPISLTSKNLSSDFKKTHGGNLSYFGLFPLRLL